MAALLTLILALLLSTLVTRVATVALTHTGLSRESARFQARSAFTGVGFTTTEAESVVNHPVRRRILMLLMLLGNVGIVTVVSSLVLAFVGREQEGGDRLAKVAVLVAGILCLWTLATSRWIDRRLSRLIDRALRRYTGVNVRDYASLLQLEGDYRVTELHVESEDWIAGKPLKKTKLRDEGINVLGIKHAAGAYEGTPDGDTVITPGDNLVLYGKSSVLDELDRRRRGWSGDVRHHKAVVQHEREQRSERVEAERARDPEAPTGVLSPVGATSEGDGRVKAREEPRRAPEGAS